MILSAMMVMALSSFATQETVDAAAEAAPPRRAVARPMATELMLELTREPRIVGTQGYDRALEVVGAALEQAGLQPERRVRKSGRAIPLRSDVLLFEDGTSQESFAGLRERWNPDTIPTMPRPMAFDHNPATADVRGPVVHVGQGLDEDFERIASLGVPLEGAVLLATLELVPSERTTTVREMASRAAAAGAAGLLIAPTPTDEGPTTRTLFVEENTIGETPLALPTAPVRAVEAEALMGRLRTKRVRGADGKATPLRLGPGPVEASIALECPLVVLTSVSELVFTPKGAQGGTSSVRRISLVDDCDRPLSGAFELTAEILSLVKGYDVEARQLSASIAPEHGSTPQAIEYVFGPFVSPECHSLLMPAALTSAGSLPSKSDLAQPYARASAVPGRFRHLDRVAAHFGDELTSLVDAAARFLAYESEVANFKGEAPVDDPNWKAIAAQAEAAAAALSRPL